MEARIEDHGETPMRADLSPDLSGVVPDFQPHCPNCGLLLKRSAPPQRSEATLELRAKLSQKILLVQAECGYVQKDRKAPQEMGGFKFASTEAVMRKVGPSCVESRLRSRPVYHVTEIDRQSRGEGKAPATTVTVRCDLYLTDAETGYEELCATAWGAGRDFGEKAVMKGQTSAYKYAWIGMLGIATGDDPEAEHVPDEPAQNSRPAAPAPASAPPAPKAEPSLEARLFGTEDGAELQGEAAWAALFAEAGEAFGKAETWTQLLNSYHQFRNIAEKLKVVPSLLRLKGAAGGRLVLRPGAQPPLIEVPDVPAVWVPEFYAIDEAGRKDRKSLVEAFKAYSPYVHDDKAKQALEAYASALAAELGFTKPPKGK